ncbi:hypothetical protein HBB16_16345 [Pseudonocardia sp. MCCB 268]|nr:hypothetical protein [Pseudonocardia cytotoxica]
MAAARGDEESRYRDRRDVRHMSPVRFLNTPRPGTSNAPRDFIPAIRWSCPTSPRLPRPGRCSTTPTGSSEPAQRRSGTSPSASGPHYCLGAVLRQAHVQARLGMALERFPNLRPGVRRGRWLPSF